MSTAGTLINLALGVVSFAFPAAGPAIAIAMKLEPYAEAAFPLIKAAISEGPAAFAAAKLQAPDFFSELGNFAAALKGGTLDDVTVTDGEIANLAAHVVGVDPPGWSHEETQRWWDRAIGQA